MPPGVMDKLAYVLCLTIQSTGHTSFVIPLLHEVKSSLGVGRFCLMHLVTIWAWVRLESKCGNWSLYSDTHHVDYHETLVTLCWPLHTAPVRSGGPCTPSHAAVGSCAMK